LSLSSLFERLRIIVRNEGAVRLPSQLGWIVLGALVLVASLVRFHLPPVAISEWDSWGWLSPALSWIGGAGFHEEFEREWLYGAFIAFCLRTTGSFSGYILIQQILGLVAAVLMWLTWRRWISLFPRNILLEIFSTLAGLFLVALYLFNPITITLELAIRPEGIMAFVALLQLFCVVSFCKFRWQDKNTPACIIFGALCLPLAWAMFVLKPNWALAVPATTLPVFLGIIGHAPRLARWLPPALGFLLLVLTLWLPDKLLFIRNGGPRVVLPMTLFTIHADIIRESMARELQSPGLTEDRREFLTGFLPELDREMQTAIAKRKFYPRIGFDPDYLMYRSSLFSLLENRWGLDKTELASFCRENFLTALRYNPLGYARKVSTQMGYFFLPDDGTFFRKRVEFGNLYDYALQTLPATPDEKLNPPTRTLLQKYLDQVKALGGMKRQLKVIPAFRRFLKSFVRWIPFIEIAFLLALTACFLWKPLAILRLPGLCALIFFSAPFGNALTVAMVHALDNSRYRGSYGPLLLFALGGMFFFFLVVATTSAVIAVQTSRSTRTT
jgi:hypothetical protein